MHDVEGALIALTTQGQQRVAIGIDQRGVDTATPQRGIDVGTGLQGDLALARPAAAQHGDAAEGVRIFDPRRGARREA